MCKKYFSLADRIRNKVEIKLSNIHSKQDLLKYIFSLEKDVYNLRKQLAEEKIRGGRELDAIIKTL